VAQRRQWLGARFASHECLVIDDAWLREACAARSLACQPIPRNDEADAVQQHFLAWLLRDVLQRQPDAIFCSEAYGPPCAAVLSQALGLPVQAVVVDLEREQLSIRATQIRARPELAREWLAPEVRAAFVRRVVLLGGESTGKTTLAQALATQLQTTWVAEYGRELWELQGGQLSEADLLRIARTQVHREEAAIAEAADWLVCDTSPLTTLGYSDWMFGRADTALASLAERHYDAVLLCLPDFNFVQDGTRRDEAFRQQQHAWYLAQVTHMNTPCLPLGGPLAKRLHAAAQWLKALPLS
jgi:HTH-type transcriptional repressor of NAD biosynthesis genes